MEEVKGVVREYLKGSLVSAAGKEEVRALLEDVDRLEKEVDDLKMRLDRCARASDDDRVKYWVNKYDRLVASMKKGEYDQG